VIGSAYVEPPEARTKPLPEYSAAELEAMDLRFNPDDIERMFAKQVGGMPPSIFAPVLAR